LNRLPRRQPCKIHLLVDALGPDRKHDVDGACFRYETGDFKLESDEHVPDPQPRHGKAL